MSYLYPLIYRGGSAWKEGLRVGIIMALFVSLPENLHVYALTNISFLKLLFPALWVTVIWGMAGIVIGMVYGGSAGFAPATLRNSDLLSPTARSDDSRVSL
jgi:hypothetical protein